METIKKGVLLLIAVLLLSFSVYARSFDASFEAVDSTITFGQLAEYKLEVRNDLSTSEDFKVKTLDYPLWEIKTDPVLNPIQFTVMPERKKEITLFINPLYVSNYGVYDVNVIVEQVSKGDKLKKLLRVNVVSPEAGTYVETVLATISVDDKIDPTKGMPIKVILNNQNIIEYPEITVKVESSLINEEIKESLGKKEKKTVTLTNKIDPKTPPQEDTIVVKLMANNKTLDTEVRRVEIIEVKNIIKKENVEMGFLKSTKEIRISNEGNIKYSDGLKVESSTLQMLFTSSRPKGRFVKEDGKRYLAIPVELAPGESTTAYVTNNYITLLIIFILLAVIIALYYVLRSPLTISKKSTNIALKEGGVSELKIILNVSNRSKRKINNIEIIDRIPNIINIEKGLTIGTLHPTKILKHERKGTVIKWHIDSLDAGDERVISYKVKSHLSIVGEFNLTPTIAVFRYNGKEVTSRSNSLGISP
ncbi:hypothetical protein KY358_05025 [Candidatus Woesearchaeota archaeon]|nr:hypothetical protein [Candidatus Woesearchaeota archaeon]